MGRCLGVQSLVYIIQSFFFGFPAAENSLKELLKGLGK